MDEQSEHRFQASNEGEITVSIAQALQDVVDHENVGPLEDEISCDGLEQLFAEPPIQNELQVKFATEDCMITVSGDRTIKIRQ